ncbi:MAG TPA: Holliday junction branch migration protein RuvA [Burkholderiales bacterium]|nr:Holliday junction branch migration protein RuvA [Burkholderiales bacterium]
MIGRISGILLEKHPPQVLIDVQGLAYELDVPMSTFYQLPATGSRTMLYTHFIVREDAQLLFGFATDGERHAFRQLVRISGIGARTALAVLSGMTVEELSQTVAAQDSARLIRVPGIGRKTAERLLLEMKGKLVPEAASASAEAGPSARDDALSALLALGYSEKEVSAALNKLGPELTMAETIRQALRLLSRVL